MKKGALGILILMVLIAGCTGSFKVTKAVYHLHRSQPDKWTDELVFIVCILPYGVAMLSDAVMFNTIEFWTGKNPVVSETGNDNSIVIVKNGNKQATLAYDALDGTVEVIPSNGEANPFILARTSKGVVVTDLSGKAMYTAQADEYGGITVCDANHQVLRYVTPKEVAESRLEFFEN
jgi:hypothetical protein